MSGLIDYAPLMFFDLLVTLSGVCLMHDRCVWVRAFGFLGVISGLSLLIFDTLELFGVLS